MVDVFIISFPRDYQFLYYALRTLKKFCTGYRKVIVLIPKQSPAPEFDLSGVELVRYIPQIHDGYVCQQAVKMRAYQHTDSEHIMFLDSDIICTQPTHLTDYYFHDEKPILWNRPFTAIKEIPEEATGVTREAIVWKARAEAALGFECPYFTMEFLPIIHNRRVLEESCKLVEKHQKTTLEAYGRRSPHPGFGEFTILGNVAMKLFPSLYHPQDGRGHKYRFNGYWSYYGVTEELKRYFESLLT